MRSQWQRYFGLQWPAAIAAVLLFAFVRTASAAPSVEVAASLPMVGEWVRAVGGEHVRVQVVAPGGADPHTFEPSVRTIQAANRSHVLFVIGLGLEPWAERLMRAEPSLKIVQIALPVSGLRRLGAAHHHHHNPQHQHRHDHDSASCPVGAHMEGSGDTAAAHSEDLHVCLSGEFDPHVWLDPVRVKEMVRVIEQTLASLSPHNAAAFSDNADAYCKQLDDLHAEMVVVFEAIEPQRRKLVTNHDNLHYFAERYGFIVMDTLLGPQGVASGQPSARRVREIVARIREHDIEALFADASSSRNLLEAVATEAGMPSPGNFYSIPTDTSGPASDYLQMMRHNAGQIALAFNPGVAP